MNRLLIIGSGGAGKSTFARHLANRLQLPLIHLDAHFWRSGWQEPDKATWHEQVDELLQGREWIMDGNYSGTLELRMQACDTLIFLDLPRLQCLWRVVKRALIHHGRSRPDMAENCPERLDLAFIAWVWRYPERTRPQIVTLLADTEKRVIHLRSSGAVARFLRRLGEMPRRGECPVRHLARQKKETLVSFPPDSGR